MSEAKEIQLAIAAYAEAYARLQELQEKSKLIPKGDQKTGCIGEFYAYLYIRARFPQREVFYGGHNEKGWDIKVRLADGSKRFQVKTVSAYADARRISPIHPGWNELFLIYLDKDFKPIGFWIVAGNSIVAEGNVLKSCVCRKPGNPSTGSGIIPFSENRVAQLIEAVDGS